MKLVSCPGIVRYADRIPKVVDNLIDALVKFILPI